MKMADAVSETKEKYLKKLKTSTIWCLVLSIIFAVTGLLSTFKLFTIDIEKEKEKLKEAAKEVGFKTQNFDQMYGTQGKIFSVVSLIVFIITVLLLILAFKKIAEGKVPSKLGYYSYILGQVIAIARIVLPGGFTSFVAIQIIFCLIIALPAILGISYLLKIDDK